MKAEAYICDYCNELKVADEMTGVSQLEDMYERLRSFPVIPHCHKAAVHLCTKCYNMHVIQVAGREFNRKFDERGYELKLKEMSYLVRSQCVANYNKKVRKKVAGSKGK